MVVNRACSLTEIISNFDTIVSCRIVLHGSCNLMKDKSCSPICVETGSKDAILCWRGICVPISGGLCPKFFAGDQIIKFYDEMIIWPCRPACLLSDENLRYR